MGNHDVLNLEWFKEISTNYEIDKEKHFKINIRNIRKV